MAKAFFFLSFFITKSVGSYGSEDFFLYRRTPIRHDQFKSYKNCFLFMIQCQKSHKSAKNTNNWQKCAQKYRKVSKKTGLHTAKPTERQKRLTKLANILAKQSVSKRCKFLWKSVRVPCFLTQSKHPDLH